MNDEVGQVAVIVVMVAIWLVMVIAGIRLAKKKNRSAHWMWFGLHPVGALVVLIVMAVAGRLQTCPRCARKAPEVAQVCAFCRCDLTSVDEVDAGQLLSLGLASRPRAEQPAAAPVPAPPQAFVPSAQRGGFGEPYCSSACYDKAGRQIADFLFQGTVGRCEFCGSSVEHRIGHAEGAALPFHGRMTFVCRLCDRRGRQWAREMSDCSFCGNPLSKTAPVERDLAGVH